MDACITHRCSILSLILICFNLANLSAQAFRGIYNESPATRWEDAFLSGNGQSGIMNYGDPLNDAIIFNHHKFIRPNNQPDIPDMTSVLEASRDQMLAGDIYGGWNNYYTYMKNNGPSEWETRGVLERSQIFHPGFNMNINISADGVITNYRHECNYESGEIIVSWDDNRGSWKRKSFVSRDDDFIVTLITKPTGSLLDCSIALVPSINHPGFSQYETLNSTSFLNFRAKYNTINSGQGGYEGVTRVILNGFSANSYFAGDVEGHEFTAESSIVESVNNSAFDLIDAITLEAWVKADTLPSGGARIIDKTTVNTSDAFLLDTYPGNSLRMITPGGNLNFAANLPNAWTHVAATYSHSQGIQRLYVNGSEVASRTPSAPLQINSNPLRIGSDSNGNNKFLGAMKRVTVYNRALSSAEISNLATVGDMSSLNLNGRVADWDLDNVTNGQVISSSSGNLPLTGISSDATSELLIENADSVLLLTMLDRYRNDFNQWNNQDLQQELSLIDKGYNQLLADHVAIHGEMFNRVRFDMHVDEAEMDLPVTQLISDQNANKSIMNKALLEKTFDTSRYLFMCSSGPTHGPRLSGVFLGDWNKAAWNDDYVVNVNYTLQIGAGNIANLAECMEGPFKILERTKSDWSNAAQKLWGCNGIVGPVRMDGEQALFTNASDFYAHNGSTGYGPWLVYSMYEHYQITGDLDFLQNRIYPFLHDMAVFYEGFLTRTDGNGDVIFVPSVSPENHSSTAGNTIASINSTFDIAACKHGLTMAIESANILGLEQRAGEGVERWMALLNKMPDYQTLPDGTLKEWAWNMNENYNHRHTSQGYVVWPAYEINPENSETSGLLDAVKIALDKRQGPADQKNAHGNLMLAYCEVRTKQADKFGARLLGLMTNEHQYNSLATSHDKNLGVGNSDAYNFDFICSIQGQMIESAVFTNPGVLELLPAMPTYLNTGSLSGIKGRNRCTIDKIEWNRGANSVSCEFTSDITQNLQIIYRDGIDLIDCTAPVSGSGIYRTVSVTAGVPVVLNINIDPISKNNLVANASFEIGGSNPTGWSRSGSATGSTTSLNTGTRSLEISTAGSSALQTVTLETGTEYSISVWINASQMSSGLAVFDTLDEYDGSGQGQFVMYNSNSDWTEYSGSFTATDDEVRIRMFTDSGFSGAVFFDDVVISPLVSTTPVEDWMALHGVSALQLDDDSDGIMNLMEFALGGDPKSEDRGQLPVIGRSGNDIAFSFNRAESIVTYVIEKSTDLSTWTDHVTVNDSHGTIDSIATVYVPNSEMSNGKLFLRLRVEE